MIDDLRQKEAALRYVVGKGWYPQLELVVRATASSDTKIFNVTDVDVYGAAPDDITAYQTVLFDCKGGGRNSPVTRALWQKGLMDHFSATRGFVVVSDLKSVPLDHRETAANLGVTLMNSAEFDAFAEATDGYMEPGTSHLAQLDNWLRYRTSMLEHPALRRILDFSSCDYWQLERPGDGCRQSIALLRSVRGELDPSKALHVMAFGDLLSLFLMSAARLSHRLFAAFLQPSSRENLDEVLRPYVYGGKSSYDLLNQLRAFVPRRGESEDFRVELPEWATFSRLIRGFLDAPIQALSAPVLAREVAWSVLDDVGDRPYARSLAASKPQTGRFCLLAAKYLGSAASLPPEFADTYQRAFIEVQSPTPQVTAPESTE